MKILFSPPDITQREIDEVVDTLESGWITTGPKTKLLEKQLADYAGAKKCVCLNSATAGMETALRLLDIGPGDEVITSAYTYSASASIIHHVGAKIVLADIDENTGLIDPQKIEEAITDKTKAVIPVDLAGIPCDYDAIFRAVERKRFLFKPKGEIQEKLGRPAVIADAAHSLGAKYKDRKVGSIADISVFSFHAVKNFTTGEGGALLWTDLGGMDSEEIYKTIQLITLHGQNKDALAKTKLGSWEYDIKLLGYKYNMPDIMAAIGLAQFKRYPELLRRRREIIKTYEDGFENTKIKNIKHAGEDFRGSGHLFITRVEGIEEEERNRIIEKMAEAGIATNVHYKPLPMHTAYKELGFDIKDYPNAYAFYKNEITLPLHTLLKDKEIEYIIEEFKKAVV
ncbi:DegT/DnrJ/EryC1/StrS family aminotransferase [Gallicola sp. Sow4_E12]|uniref:DegT/DnrJ/EryC1/StrS family aminotransferase n=1 Tax=Gallicola sp. Sow4_E12 TaxID=3438785 RepID=UPI003F8F6E9B